MVVWSKAVFVGRRVLDILCSGDSAPLLCIFLALRGSRNIRIVRECVRHGPFVYCLRPWIFAVLCECCVVGLSRDSRAVFQNVLVSERASADSRSTPTPMVVSV